MSDLHRAEMAESKLDWIKRWIEAQPPQIRDAYRAVLTTIDAEVWDGYQRVPDPGLFGDPHYQRLDHKEP